MSVPDSAEPPFDLGEWLVLRREVAIAAARRRTRELAAVEHRPLADEAEPVSGESLTKIVRHGACGKTRVTATGQGRVHFAAGDQGRMPFAGADPGDSTIMAALARAWGLAPDEDGTPGWFETP